MKSILLARRGGGLATLVLAIGLVAACGSDAATATPVPTPIPRAGTADGTPTATSFQVPIANLKHSDITAPVGTTVVWTNKDTVPHTVTSGRDGKFDGTGWNSPALNQGQTFSRVFTQTGTFAYTCTIHPTINATVTVTQSGTASAATGTSGGSGGGTDYNY